MKRFLVLGLLLLVTASLMFTGCFTFDDAVSGIIGEAGKDTEEKLEQEEEKAMREAFGIDDMSTQAMGMQFYGIYGTTVGLGGYSFPANFEEGQGTLWKISASDSDEPVYVERALLKRLSGGNEWWMLKYEAEDFDILYEYQTDSESNFTKIRFRDPDTGEIREYVPQQQQETTEQEASGDYDEGEWAEYTVGTERVTVGAGTFTTDHVKVDNKDNEFTWEWWMSEDVPGKNVKYQGVDTTEDYVLEGELMEINSGYRTQLNSY